MSKELKGTELLMKSQALERTNASGVCVFGMKIVFIVPHFPPHIGGGEQLYKDVCLSLIEKGNEVRVITSSSGGVTGHKTYEGIEVWYCDWKMMFGHPIVQISDIAEHVKWCDIVHTTIYSTAIKSIRQADKEHKPSVVTVHEVMGEKWFWFEKNFFKALAFRTYEGLIMKASKNVHVVSESTGRDYKKSGRYSGRVFKIYNFLNLPADEEVAKENISFHELFSLKDEERGILYFGRPAPNKGIFVLLEAINEIKEELKGKNVFFCMILSKDPAGGRKRALEYIENNGLKEIIRIKDSLPRLQLLKVLSGADLVVIPSITEGFGYAACEACHYKRPVISSDGGSLPEVVSGKCLFYENRNARDLAGKLLEYVNNGTDNFDDVADKVFDRGEIVEQYLEMYRCILGRDTEGEQCT